MVEVIPISVAAPIDESAGCFANNSDEILIINTTADKKIAVL